MQESQSMASPGARVRQLGHRGQDDGVDVGGETAVPVISHDLRHRLEHFVLWTAREVRVRHDEQTGVCTFEFMTRATELRLVDVGPGPTSDRKSVV